MIQYLRANTTSIESDALLLDVDCLGIGIEANILEEAIADKVRTAYKAEFDGGRVEPGRLILVHCEQCRPSYIFLLPTRVHTKGTVRLESLRSGLQDLLDQVLKLGIKSIAFSQMIGNQEFDWPAIKLELLATFARVPQIGLQVYPRVKKIAPPKHVAIFADGACTGTPGIGGYGVVLRFGHNYKELSAGYQSTSNQRMELMGAIAGLEALKEPCYVRLHSDSQYVIDIVNRGLLFRLATEGRESLRMKHGDLWKRFLTPFLKHDVEMVWVKGHAGIQDNERCDQLASEAMRSTELLTDQIELTPKAPSNGSVQGSSKAIQYTKKVETQPASLNGSSQKKGPCPKKAGDPCHFCAMPVVQKRSKNKKKKPPHDGPFYLLCEACSRAYPTQKANVSSKL